LQWWIPPQDTKFNGKIPSNVCFSNSSLSDGSKIILYRTNGISFFSSACTGRVGNVFFPLASGIGETITGFSYPWKRES